MTTPVQQGFFMPPEWHPHSQCRMAFPNRFDVWTDEVGFKNACRAYAAVAKAIAHFEPITMLVNANQQLDAAALCGPSVKLMVVTHNDSWHRDTGATFVISRQGELAGINWQFNDYGNKENNDYSVYADDVDLAGRLLDELGIKRFNAPLILEGGSIHVDGEGTLITTEDCLLNPNRNPNLSREQIEEHLKAYVGVSKIIWLKHGLRNDDTDGHVDNVACFVGVGKVVALISSDPNDENYANLQENLATLRNATDAKGRPLEVFTIEQPKPTFTPEGERLGLSYINFYIANGGIVACSFDDPERDAACAATLKQLFPERQVVQIPAVDLYMGGGGVHCITQQQPLPIVMEE